MVLRGGTKSQRRGPARCTPRTRRALSSKSALRLRVTTHLSSLFRSTASHLSMQVSGRVRSHRFHPVGKPRAEYRCRFNYPTGKGGSYAIPLQ